MKNAKRQAGDMLANRGWFPSGGPVPFDVVIDLLMQAFSMQAPAEDGEFAPVGGGEGATMGYRDGHPVFLEGSDAHEYWIDQMRKVQAK